jgi:linearmycin/streptolysin S transport system permease protein
MSKALDIALKDLFHSLRSAMGLVFMFGLPLLVTGLFYLMFGNIASNGGFDLPRTRLVIANDDRNAPALQGGTRSVPGGITARTLSELVVKVFQSQDLADLFQVVLAPDGQAARSMVDNRQADVAVVIPAGFSRDFADPYAQSSIEFYQDPTLSLGPGIVKSVLNQFMDGISGVKLAIDLALNQLPNPDPALVGQVAQRFMDSSPSQSKNLSAELLDTRPPGAAAQSDNPLVRIIGPIMGGMMLFYAFYSATATGQSILREEEQHTLQRLFTTPTSQTTILSGKFLSVFLTVLVQISVLLLVSHFIFGVQWGSLPSILATAAACVILASSFGIFVNSMMKGTKQGGMVFGGVITITGMVGMIRIFGMNAPGANRLGSSVSLLVPQGWAVRALIDSISAAPFKEILFTVLVMLAWSVVLFAIGVWRFRHRFA